MWSNPLAAKCSRVASTLEWELTMRLLKIGVHSYLEVISVDPDAVPPQRKRWFELDTLFRRLVHGWQHG